MEHIISISEILGDKHNSKAPVEVIATADATYDSAAQKVTVALDSFARRTSATGDGKHLPATWLPPAECVGEHLARSEAAEFAKDVFQSWARKVHDSIPRDLPRRTTP